MVVTFIFLHIFLIIKINCIDYITSDLSITIEKGEQKTYYMKDDLIKRTALIHCSLEGAMEIKNGTNELLITQLYVIKPEKSEFANEYKINLKSKKYSYFFEIYFINLSASYIDYKINEFSSQYRTLYSFYSIHLIFVDSRKLKDKKNKMLHYRHIGGNDFTLKYFPLNNNINWNDLIFEKYYSINETIGNPIYPNDDYFITKIIGSTIDIFVEYFSGNIFNNSNSISSF